MRFGHKTTDIVQRAGAALGIHVTRIDNTLPHKRQQILASLGVDVVLDIGANVGHWVQELREHGHAGRIVSFEPIASVHAELVQRCGVDPHWQGWHTALGDSDGTSEINVSQNRVSSSLLTVTERSVGAARATAIETRESITVRRLDSLRAEVMAGAARAYMKIDVQGFERQVLAGARAALSQVAALELELSLAELYAGQALMPEMMQLAANLGYRAVWLERGFKDPQSGHLLQMDGVFVREDLLRAR